LEEKYCKHCREKMEELYRKLERLTVNSDDPLMVAGVMMAQALKIYKIMLSEEEFRLLTDHISQSAEHIETEPQPGPSIH
jgi:hypothetical protein